MNRRKRQIGQLTLLVMAVVALSATTLPFLRAQGGPSLRWGNVSAGYGVSQGSGYRVAGTSGEVDAGGLLSGNGLQVIGGFWGPVEEPPPWVPPIVVTQYRLYLPALRK